MRIALIKPSKFSYRMNIFFKYLVTVNLLFFHGLISSEELVSGYAITSEKAIIDKGFQNITYLGNVKLTHARFVIRGDTLTSSNLEGRNSGFSVSGDSCSFTETKEAETDQLYASAKEIIFKQPEQVLILRGNVVFSKNGDSLEASSINYDINTKKISAKSDEGGSPIRLVIKSL